PLSGSPFQLGTTPVTATAHDGFGNTASCTFNVMVVPGSCPCVPPPTNMVLWLPFDETTGKTSGNLASPKNPGTQVNNPVPLQNAYVANSLSFNGASPNASHVEVPDYPALEIGNNDLTIDAWVYLTAAQRTNYVILDKSPYSGNFPRPGYTLWLNPDLGLFLNLSGQLFVQHVPISTNQWHFIAVSVTQNGSTPQGFFYLDGSLAGTFTPTPVNLANTKTLWVGASPSGVWDNGSPTDRITNFPWKGALDEIEVFNRALAVNELQSIYSAGASGKCKPCCYLKNLSIKLVHLSPNTVEVIWDGCGTLEQAPSPTGPWTAIPGAPSPYIANVTGAQMHFRVVCQ
ncbi:MAG: hypothetical protein C5B50_22795, partial [Verrucomicrobia bacterium]